MGKAGSEIAAYVRNQGLAMKQAFVASGNGQGQAEYIGFSSPGTLTSASKWQIQKLAYDSSNRLTTITWADGNDNMDNVWDDRTSLTYA